MNIFLLGNGFDLHHKLPTRYFDFLQVVHFIVENKDESFTTVGDIFSKANLQSTDDFISTCYRTHSTIYNNTKIDESKLSEIATKAESNLWFKYLYSSVDEDIKWIDFEKEIHKVIHTFMDFFDTDSSSDVNTNGFYFDFLSHPDNAQLRYIIKQFDFFYEDAKSDSDPVPSEYKKIKKGYSCEEPIGSNYYVINTKAIASNLFESLADLSEILRYYLELFVDNPTNNIIGKPRCASYPIPDYVFSFNYTNTCEIMYNFSNVEHIHGKVDSNIVLGVNPDKSDELDCIETTFIQFKKYYQRVFWGTDTSFLSKFNRLKKNKDINNELTLYVIGHSLDITDEDIIKKIFELSKKIIVLYHSKDSVKDYIKNLIELYGKESFDALRVSKGLCFKNQADVVWPTE